MCANVEIEDENNKKLMKTILVPFDFSPFSLAALQTAEKINAKTHAKIICVTVVPSELDWDLLSESAKSQYPELLAQQEEAMEVFPEYLKAVTPNKSKLDLVVKIGVPYEQILRVADQLAVDMLVIGAHGKGDSSGVFIGSTVQRVLRSASCPVLAVKQALDGNAFRKVAFATVFNGAGKAAFEKILPLAKVFKSSIHLVYVNTPSHFTNSAQSDLDMAAFGKGHEEFVIHRHIYNDQDPVRGIMGFCEKNKIRLVAIAPGEHSHASAYQVGTTETLIFRSDLGVLSLKA